MSNPFLTAIEALRRDLQFSLLALAKAPAFTCIAALTLALGIGASATVSSVSQSVAMDPVAYPQASRLVDIWTNNGQQPLSTPDYLDQAARNTSFSSMAAFSYQRYNLGGEQAESVQGVLGTPSLLPTLAVPPALGRWFNEGDAESEAPQTVIISHGLWQRRFGGDPAILGHILRVNGQDTRIVGVMPADFLFQTARSHGRDVQVWLPLRLRMEGEDRTSQWLEAIARLRPGISLEQAHSDVRRIGEQLTREHPLTNQHKPFCARSLVAETTDAARANLPMLMGAVALVLLMACANAASLLLARGSHRQAEFALRFSMGATKGAVIRLCLAESAILACLGTLGGVSIAAFGIPLLRALLVIPQLPGKTLHLDSTLLMIGGALALLATCIAGLPSALAAARTPLFQTMKDGGKGHTGSRTRRRFLQQLVAVQILLAFLLVNGALLLLGSYLNVWKQNRSLDTDRVITAGITLRGDQYSTVPGRVQFWERYLERVQAIPGVKAAGMTSKLPLEGGNNGGFLVEGEAYDPTARRPLVERSSVSPGYFSAMGISLLRGSAPDGKASNAAGPSPSGEGSRPGMTFTKVVVNRAFADHYWPGQNPIGKPFWNNRAAPDETYIVVGEAENVRQWGAEESCQPELFWPYPAHPRSEAFLVVQSDGEAHRLVSALRQELASLDSDLALSKVRTMDQVLSDATQDRRTMMQVVSGFMGLSVLLALVGIYGTVSYTIARQQKEVGIRRVLGAKRLDIVRHFLRQLMPSVLGGIALGTVCSLALIRFARSYAYGVDPANPWLLTGIALALLTAGLLTTGWPAMRTTRGDLATPLREE